MVDTGQDELLSLQAMMDLIEDGVCDGGNSVSEPVKDIDYSYGGASIKEEPVSETEEFDGNEMVSDATSNHSLQHQEDVIDIDPELQCLEERVPTVDPFQFSEVVVNTNYQIQAREDIVNKNYLSQITKDVESTSQSPCFCGDADSLNCSFQHQKVAENTNQSLHTRAEADCFNYLFQNQKDAEIKNQSLLIRAEVDCLNYLFQNNKDAENTNQSLHIQAEADYLNYSFQNQKNAESTNSVFQICENVNNPNYPFINHENSDLVTRPPINHCNVVGGRNYLLQSQEDTFNNEQPPSWPRGGTVITNASPVSCGNLVSINNPYQICVDSVRSKNLFQAPEDVVNSNRPSYLPEDEGKTNNLSQFYEDAAEGNYPLLTQDDTSKNCPSRTYEDVINLNDPLLPQAEFVFMNESFQVDNAADQNSSLVQEDAASISSQAANTPRSLNFQSDVWSNSIEFGNSSPIDSFVKDEPEIEESNIVTEELVCRLSESRDSSIIDNKITLKGVLKGQTQKIEESVTSVFNATKEVTLDCNLCSAKFKRKDALRIHLMKHSGVKYLSCSHCTMKFATRQEMLNHSKVHDRKLPLPGESEFEHSSSHCSTKLHKNDNFKNHLKQLRNENFVSDSFPNDVIECMSGNASIYKVKDSSNSKINGVPYKELNFSSNPVSNILQKDLSNGIYNFKSNPPSIPVSYNAPKKASNGTSLSASCEVSNSAPCSLSDALSCASDSVSECAPHDSPVECSKKNNLRRMESIDKVNGEGANFSCFQCPLRFSHPNSLAEHLKEHSEEKPFSRSQCLENFKNQSALEYHINKTHIVGESSSESPSIAKPATPSPLFQEPVKVPSDRRQFLCEYCPSLFKKKCALLSHLKSHSQFQLPSQIGYSCNVCCRRFASPAKLKNHEKVSATCRKSSKYLHCSEKNGKGNDLEPVSYAHSKICDAGDSYDCPGCAANFTTSAKLRNHLRHHNERKPYSCEHCPAQFFAKRDIERHLVSHLKVGASKYSCAHCSAKFDQLRSFKHHLAFHSNPRFVCAQCPGKFYSRNNLLVHSKIHLTSKPATVSESSKKLVKVQRSSKERVKVQRSSVSSNSLHQKSSNLQESSKNHKQEAYSCLCCPAIFTKQQSLNSHMRKHNNIKFLVCSLCSLKFSTLGKYRKHLTNHINSTSNSLVRRNVKSDLKKGAKKCSKLRIGLKRFSCTDCPAVFTCMRSLQNHLKCHSYNTNFQSYKKLFACLHCSAKFERSDLFARHLLVHSDGKASVKIQFPAEISNETWLNYSTIPGEIESISTGNLSALHFQVKKESSDAGILFVCPYCNAQFKCNGTLQKHVMIHVRQKPFTCTQCPAKFLKESNFQEHLRRHERGRDDGTNKLKSSKKLSLIKYLERQKISKNSFEACNVQEHYACRYCSAKFLQKTSLDKHLLKHKTFACDQCPEKFFSRHGINGHIKVHMAGNKSSHACSFCTAKFERRHNLLKHLKLHPSQTLSGSPKQLLKPREFSCTKCPQKCQSRNDLRRHQEIHTNRCGRLHSCSHCTAKFVQKQNLFNHLKLHSNQQAEKQMDSQKGYNCLHCPAKFFSKKDLIGHQKVHLDSIKRFYACSHCSAKFKLSQQLMKHAKLHTNQKLSGRSNQPAGKLKWHSCTECPYRTQVKQEFQRHLIVHVDSDERLYACSYCTAKYLTPVQLMRHSKVHADQKPSCSQNQPAVKESGLPRYSCTECSYRTHLKQDLQKHLKVHVDSDGRLYARHSKVRVDQKPSCSQNQPAGKESGLGGYSCNKCPYRTPLSRAFSKHQEVHVPGKGKVHTCSLCSAKFKYQSGLIAHLKMHKDAESSHDSCQSAENQPVVRKSNLQKLNLNCGKRPFACTFCSAKYMRLSDLSKHSKVCSASTKRSRKCKIMNQGSSCGPNQPAVKQRKRQCKSHSCPECPAEFSKKTDLSRHQESVHVDIGDKKLHACSHCSAKYERLFHLVRHEKLHAD